MSQDEVSAIYKAKSESDRQSWEQTRLLCYYNVVSQNGTKVFKRPSDLFPLSWDQTIEDHVDKGKRLTREEFLNTAKQIIL